MFKSEIERCHSDELSFAGLLNFQKAEMIYESACIE